MSHIPLPPPPITQTLPPQEPRSGWSARRWVAIGLGVFALLCVMALIAGVLIARLFNGDILTTALQHNDGRTGPAVPWPTIVATAQKEMQKRDKSAVLREVSASSLGFQPTNFDYGHLLKVGFDYVNPTGYVTAISMYDNDPASTLEVDQRQSRVFDKGFYDMEAAKQNARLGRLASMKLGPREAGSRTWQDALAHANGNKLDPFLDLDLNEEPANWHILYTPSGRALLDFSNEMSFDVNAETGEIISSDYGFTMVEYPTPVP